MLFGRTDVTQTGDELRLCFVLLSASHKMYNVQYRYRTGQVQRTAQVPSYM